MCLVHITLLQWYFRYISKYSLFPKFCWIFFFVVSVRTFQTPETLKNILDSPNNRKNTIYTYSVCVSSILHYYMGIQGILVEIFTFHETLADILLCRVIQNILDSSNTENVLNSPNNQKNTIFTCLVCVWSIQHYYMRIYGTLVEIFTFHETLADILLCGVIQNILDSSNTENVLNSPNNQKNTIYTCLVCVWSIYH